MDEIVKSGWYRIVLKNGQRFTGKCTGIKSYLVPHGKKMTSFIFDIGSDENDTTTRIGILMIVEEDLRSCVRLSPRYIETVETKGKGGWIHYRYKGLFKYGEE